MALPASPTSLYALVGIRRSGRITWQEVVGARWGRWQTIIGDLGIALATLVTMAVIGNLSNVVLGPFQHDSAAFHSMVAQNAVEAFAFLALALTAGFVEEFVFRGYIQRQCQALCGNTVVASILQLIIFSQGHLYQGWIRLVPVFLIGVVVTIVALWRKSLIPGMIAHGLGDGPSFSFSSTFDRQEAPVVFMLLLGHVNELVAVVRSPLRSLTRS